MVFSLRVRMCVSVVLTIVMLVLMIFIVVSTPTIDSSCAKDEVSVGKDRCLNVTLTRLAPSHSDAFQDGRGVALFFMAMCCLVMWLCIPPKKKAVVIPPPAFEKTPQRDASLRAHIKRTLQHFDIVEPTSDYFVWHAQRYQNFERICEDLGTTCVYKENEGYYVYLWGRREETQTPGLETSLV